MNGRPRSITIFSHTRPGRHGGGAAPDRRAGRARRAWRCACRAAEVEKFGHGARACRGRRRRRRPTDLAVVLGGDGTILTALRAFAGTGVPVFAVNFGAIGFLATIEPWELEEGVRRALRGEFDVMDAARPGRGPPDGERLAVNDVSLHRRQDGRVAELAYSVEGEELGEVRCDGLVVVDSGGLDGLQPRQRRAGAGLGRGGLRRLVHRAAHAHGPGARGRPGRHARGDEPLAVRGGRRLRPTAARVCTLAPEATMRIRFEHAPGAAGADARARASTTACATSSAASALLEALPAGPRPSVASAGIPGPCSSSYGSRTCC